MQIQSKAVYIADLPIGGFDWNAVPTPRPTWPMEIIDDGTPTATPGGLPPMTPVPVRCSAADAEHCLLLPTVRK